MNINPLNAIQSSLGDLCGSTHPVKTAAYKIRSGLVNQGFSVVSAAQVDRLHTLLTDIRVDDEDVPSLLEALDILGDWK